MSEHRFGSRLRAARKKRGLTQRQLAEKVGVSQPMIARWESGRTDVVLGTAFRLAKALKVPPETLMLRNA